MVPGQKLILALLTLAFGCNRPAPPAAATAPAVTITVVKPEKKALQRFIEQPGMAQAVEETVLHAKLPGFVDRIADDPLKAKRAEADRQYDIGSVVKKEDLLAVLSIPELDSEKKEKLALVKQAEAEVTQSEKGRAAAAAAVVSAAAFRDEMQASVAKADALFQRWQLENLRIAGMVKEGVVDRQVEDETRNQFKAAEAVLGEAKARVVSANAAWEKAKADEAKAAADVSAVTAKLDVARAGVQGIDDLRKYTEIRAPFDGVITRRSLSTGEFVGGPGKQGLFTVARVNPLRIVISVPEADADAVALGQAVKMLVGGKEQTGNVARTSWSLAAGSRSLRVEVDLANADRKLRPGSFVSAKLTVDLPEAWTVPAAAVAKSGDDMVIYLVENGITSKRIVEPLKGNGQLTQVRRNKKPGAADWNEFTGQERLATPAAAVSDGQEVK